MYSSALIKLPTPNFVVFYNGDIEIGDVSEYRLSDSYMTSVEEPALELRVTVLNVNYGKNVKLMEQCESLKEYAQYVALVRKYKQETGSLDDGVKLAIEHCINEGILEDFLRKNRSEVEMTSIFEYNKEEEERKLRSAEREAGYAKGKLAMLIQLVNNNVISTADAAKQINMSEEEFVEKMKQNQ